MSGDRRQAQPAGGRPLDGGVRPRPNDRQPCEHRCQHLRTWSEYRPSELLSGK